MVPPYMFRVMSSEGGEVTKALKLVLERMKTATAARTAEVAELCPQPRLVAVSKTKPKEMVIEAYLAGQRHFGENYIKELVMKAYDQEMLDRCPDIKWHLIGPIQGNKANKVVAIPHLSCVETVHSSKLATQLDQLWTKKRPAGSDDRLSVFVQVNTSNEPQKSGVAPERVTEVTEHILTNCTALRLQGLMTIGAFDHDLSKGPNQDFQVLLSCREAVCQHHCIPAKDVELSMGMSGDFEHAIAVGSTNVRVGSTIFGSRNYT